MSFKNILVVSGESSGDVLTASIIQELKQKSPHLIFTGCGGEKMEKEGANVLYPIEALSSLGFTEVITKYFFIKKVLRDLLKYALDHNVKTAILVDYQGFNLLLAKQLKKHNIQCIKIVSPQIWAWRPKRIHKIKKYFDSVLCLFSFETKIYTNEDIQVKFIGHPLIYKTLSYQQSINWIPQEHTPTKSLSIALLPGSRKSEIKTLLPFLIQLATKIQEQYPQSQFFIPISSQSIHDFIHSNFIIPKFIQLKINGMMEILSQANLAIVSSGTATLETALWKVPFTIIYKSNFINYWLTKKLILIPYIGLVNILRKKFIVQEFLQQDMKLENVLNEVHQLIENKEYRATMLDEFDAIVKQEYVENPAKLAAEYLYQAIV